MTRINRLEVAKGTRSLANNTSASSTSDNADVYTSYGLFYTNYAMELTDSRIDNNSVTLTAVTDEGNATADVADPDGKVYKA